MDAASTKNKTRTRIDAQFKNLGIQYTEPYGDVAEFSESSRLKRLLRSSDCQLSNADERAKADISKAAQVEPETVAHNLRKQVLSVLAATNRREEKANQPLLR